MSEALGSLRVTQQAKEAKEAMYLLASSVSTDYRACRSPVLNA